MATALDNLYSSSKNSSEPQNKKKTKIAVKRAKSDGEKRERRVQLLMKPTLYEQLKEYADSQNISCNAAIEKMLLEYLKKNPTE